MKFSDRFIVAVIGVVVIIALVSLGFYLIVSYEVEDKPEGVYVRDVIDGDTFELSDGTSVRLLCVDTPEKGQDGYERATRFLESLVLYQEVRLVEGENLDKVDKYDRDLRFVYVNLSNKEVFVNKEIVRLGFGNLYIYGDETGECLGSVGG